jgi:SOS response regulatory protein OraA/RecX
MRAGPDAMTLALKALGHKERSERELAEWLRERVDDEEEVAGVIGELIETGGLDDARFATEFASDKRELRGWGPERIRDALVARGIPSGEVESALADETPDDELDRAVDLLVERGEDLGDERGRGRALAFLGRQGYGYDTAYAAVRRAEQPGKAA